MRNSWFYIAGVCAFIAGGISALLVWGVMYSFGNTTLPDIAYDRYESAVVLIGGALGIWMYIIWMPASIMARVGLAFLVYLICVPIGVAASASRWEFGILAYFSAIATCGVMIKIFMLWGNHKAR